MKKITAELNIAASQLEHQQKDLLNDLADSMDLFYTELKRINGTNKVDAIFNGRDRQLSHLCDGCKQKADYILFNVKTCLDTTYCETCLIKASEE